MLEKSLQIHICNITIGLLIKLTLSFFKQLIAEAWDTGGLYQVGMFPHWGIWSEWNGKVSPDAMLLYLPFYYFKDEHNYCIVIIHLQYLYFMGIIPYSYVNFDP